VFRALHHFWNRFAGTGRYIETMIASIFRSLRIRLDVLTVLPTRRWRVFVSLLLVISSLIGPYAAAQITDRTSKSVANTPAVPIETQAKFAVILDFASGDVLYAKRATTPTAPASMSKLMTAAIVFDQLKGG